MKIHRVVFPVSSAVILLFVLLGAFLNAPMGKFLTALQDLIITQVGWFYIAAVAFFFVFVIWLFFSRFGDIRLGKDAETPDYSYSTWFAMLFSAGMGIGLLFFSVAEPVLHFATPPQEGEPETIEAARNAMTVTFFHWGLHAWAIYIIIALSLAYFSFRHDLPLSIRSALYPLLGDRIHGAAGNLVDIFAVFGTLFGLATSLGLGVMQVNSGLEYLGLLKTSTANQVILIIVITLAATISVVSGLDKGIRRLSELNLLLASLLLIFVLLAGPTVFLLSAFIENIGNYASSLIEMTFRTDAFIGLDWQKNWTMFYWAWWISWSPFVGMFIARVSRGRTIREFIGGVFFVPSALTFFWLTVFGDTALYLDLFKEGKMAEAVVDSIPTAVFVMLDQLPLSFVTAVLVTAVVTVFFVTSSDSGSLVIDIITSGGDADPPVAQRIFWALTEGAVAAILLVTGGLVALQTAAIATALPFGLVILLICVGLVKGLRSEVKTRDALWTLMPRIGGAGDVEPVKGEVAPAIRMRGSVPEKPNAGEDWPDILAELVTKVGQSPIQETTIEAAQDRMSHFIQDVAVPAFESLTQELAKHGREGIVDQGSNYASIQVMRNGREEFAYAMRGHVFERMGFAFPEHGRREKPVLVERAETIVRGGRARSHAIQYWTREAIIHDFLKAYSKWMGW